MTEDLKKYSRRDVGTLAAAVGARDGAAARGVGRGRRRKATSRSRRRTATCDAYFVAPTTGAHAAVLVWPDIFGLRPALQQMGKRLAEDGYSVLVVNPFYREKKAPTAPQGAQTAIPALVPMMQALTADDAGEGREGVHRVARRAFSEVDKSKKVGTIGYCMGGPIVVRTARGGADRVGAVGSFHGGGLDDDGRRTARIS